MPYLLRWSIWISLILSGSVKWEFLNNQEQYCWCTALYVFVMEFSLLKP